MNEHERMLAEGPRVAPEPPAAVDSMPAGSSPPAPAPTTQGGARRARRPLTRLVPLGLLAVFLALSHAGLGRYAFLAFIAVAAGAGLIEKARRARK